jgi:hypothetical protein
MTKVTLLRISCDAPECWNHIDGPAALAFSPDVTEALLYASEEGWLIAQDEELRPTSFLCPPHRATNT